MSEEQNLADLFANLNQISANTILRERTGGGKGGSAMPLEGNQDPNPLIKFNPFLGKNVTSFQEGGTMLMKQFPSPYNFNFMNQPYFKDGIRPNINYSIYPSPIRNVVPGVKEPYINPKIREAIGSIIRKRRTGESVTQEEQDTLKSVLPGGFTTTKKIMAKGGKNVTPTQDEINKVAAMGRNGDTRLAHVTPQEERMLKAMGGSGTINPYTGMPEYFLGDLFSSIFNAFDAVLDPVQDAAGDIITGAGNTVNQAISTGTNLAGNVIDAAGQTASNLGGQLTNVLNPIVDPIFDTAQDVAAPIFDAAGNLVQEVGGAVSNVADMTSQAFADVTKGVGFQTIDLLQDVDEGVRNFLASLFGARGGMQEIDLGAGAGRADIKRGAQQRGGEVVSGVQSRNRGKALANISKTEKASLGTGDFVSPKENPYITPNVEVELDYAAQGMKMPDYNMGGLFTKQANQAIAMDQLSALTNRVARKQSEKMKKGGKFKPHMMYDPKTGKAYKANKVEDHNRMSKKGYTHTKPKKKRNFTNGGRF